MIGMLRKSHKKSINNNLLENDHTSKTVGICNMLTEKSFLYDTRY